MFHLDPASQALYPPLYNKVYLKIYPQLHSPYKTIRRTTWLPAPVSSVAD